MLAILAAMAADPTPHAQPDLDALRTRFERRARVVPRRRASGDGGARARRPAADRRGDPAGRSRRQAAAAGVLLLGLPGGGRRRRRADRAGGRRARAAPHDGVDPRRPHGSEPGTAWRSLQRDPADRAGAPAWLAGPRARRRLPRAAGRRPRRGARRPPLVGVGVPTGPPGRRARPLSPDADRHGARARHGRHRRRPRAGHGGGAQGRVIHGGGTVADRRGAGRRRRVRHGDARRVRSAARTGVPAPGRRARRRRDARAGAGGDARRAVPGPALEARELDPDAVRALSALADLVAAG